MEAERQYYAEEIARLERDYGTEYLDSWLYQSNMARLEAAEADLEDIKTTITERKKRLEEEAAEEKRLAEEAAEAKRIAEEAADRRDFIKHEHEIKLHFEQDNKFEPSLKEGE